MTIHAKRMKAVREHHETLSDRAITFLNQARGELLRANKVVFASENSRLQGHHPMERMMKALKIGTVPNEFRSSLLDCAAHRRSDLFERAEHPCRSGQTT